MALRDEEGSGQWEDAYVGKFEATGFKRGIGAPTTFHNKTSGVRVVVHGDEFTFNGGELELKKMRRKVEEE